MSLTSIVPIVVGASSLALVVVVVVLAGDASSVFFVARAAEGHWCFISNPG